MATVTKTIGFTIDINLDAIVPQSPEVFIYRMLNGLGNEHTIKSVTVDDVTVPIASKTELYDLPLGEDKSLNTSAKAVVTKK